MNYLWLSSLFLGHPLGEGGMGWWSFLTVVFFAGWVGLQWRNNLWGSTVASYRGWFVVLVLSTLWFFLTQRAPYMGMWIPLGVILAMMMATTTRINVRLIRWVGVGMAAIAIFQYASGFAELLSWLRQHPQSIPDPIERRVVEETLLNSRVIGLFISPNMLAGFLAMILLLHLDPLVRPRGPFWGFMVLGFLITAMILTRSVGGWLVLTTLMGFFVLNTSSSWRWNSWLFLGVLAAACTVLWWRPEIFSWSHPSNPLANRWNYWGHAVRLIRASPLLGTGMGRFGEAVNLAEWTPYTSNAHNAFLHVTAESGLIGGGLMMTWIVLLLTRVWRGPQSLQIKLAATALPFQSAFDLGFSRPELWLFWNGFMGAILTATPHEEISDPSQVAWQALKRRPAAPLWIVMILGFFLLPWMNGGRHPLVAGVWWGAILMASFLWWILTPSRTVIKGLSWAKVGGLFWAASGLVTAFSLSPDHSMTTWLIHWAFLSGGLVLIQTVPYAVNPVWTALGLLVGTWNVILREWLNAVAHLSNQTFFQAFIHQSYTLPNVNLYAAVVAIGALASWFLREEESLIRWRNWLTAGSAVCFLVLALTLSRGALLAATISLLLTAWWSGLTVSPTVKRGLGGIAIVVALTIGLRVFIIDDPMSFHRLVTWKTAGRMFLEHPFVGGGWGTFEFRYAALAPPLLGGLALHGKTTPFAHNEYLQAWSEGGTVAGLVLLGAIGFVLFRLKETLQYRSLLYSGAVRAGAAGLLFLIFHSAVDFPLRLPFLGLMALCCFAMIGGAATEVSHLSVLHRLYRAMLLIGVVLWISVGGSLYAILKGEKAGHEGRLQEERAWYERGLSLNPQSADLWDRLGTFDARQIERSHRLDQMLQAAASYKRAIRLNRVNPYYPRHLGRLAHHMYDATQQDLWRTLAEEALTEAIARSPHDPFIRLDRAGLAWHHGRFAEALRDLERVVSDEPHCLRAHLLIGLTLEQLGRRPEAIKIYQRVVAMADQRHDGQLYTDYERDLMHLEPSALEEARNKIRGSGPVRRPS